MIAILLLSLAADPHQKAYDRLAREYDDAIAAYRQAFDAAATPKEKQAVFETRHPKVEGFAVRFMKVARDGAESPAAVEALTWVVLHPVAPGREESGLRATALSVLARQHGKDPRLGTLCTRLVMTVDPDSEGFLREITRRATDRPALARATASLAHNLRYRAGRIVGLKEDKAALAEYQRVWGKPAIDALMKRDPDALEKEALGLFERVQARFAAEPHPLHGTLGAFAAAHLAAIKGPVGEGKPAPEISGPTLDGKEMTLSGHRGQVVLLDFWAHGFGPSRDRYGWQKKLLARLDGKPFAMLGVNADGDRKAAVKAGLTWPSWADGGPGGPIATRWDVEQWPSVILIDHKGVIRHLWAGWPDDKELDGAIDALIAKVGK